MFHELIMKHYIKVALGMKIVTHPKTDFNKCFTRYMYKSQNLGSVANVNSQEKTDLDISGNNKKHCKNSVET